MKKLYIIAVIVAVYFLLRKPLLTWYANKQSGLQAAQSSALETGYTTYNTQIYTPPKWFPSLNFFKAGAYTGSAGQSQGVSTNQVDYGVQG